MLSGCMMITEELMPPKEYTEEEIQALIDGAKLEPPHYGREGPLWGQRVYFYTDYDNDDVKTFPWFGDLEKLDIALQKLS